MAFFQKNQKVSVLLYKNSVNPPCWAVENLCVVFAADCVAISDPKYRTELKTKTKATLIKTFLLSK